MKLLDRDGRLFGKLSIIDGIALLVVAVLAVAIYVKSQMPQTGSSVTTTSVIYQMRLVNQPAYMLDAIQVGDQMFDKERSTGGSLGTILDIAVSDGTNQGELDDGTVALNRIYDLGVNSHRNFNTKYASFVGQIVDIQIQDAAQ